MHNEPLNGGQPAIVSIMSSDFTKIVNTYNCKLVVPIGELNFTFTKTAEWAIARGCHAHTCYSPNSRYRLQSHELT